MLVPTVGWIRTETIDSSGRDLHVELRPSAQQRRQPIVFLFSQPMRHIAESAHMGGALRGLIRRAFAA